MKRIQTATIPLLAAAFCAFSGREDHPVFAPEADSEVQKTFERELSFELDDLSINVGGQDLGEMLGSMEASFTIDSTTAITDTYTAVSDGKPEQLVRTFDTISSELSAIFQADMGGDDSDSSKESDLEGSTVVFSWDEEEGEYIATFEDGEGDEDLLAGLEEDMDLRVLLPDGEVAEGDQWEVAVLELNSILFPGGDLGLTTGDEADSEGPAFLDDILERDFDDFLADLFDGTCTCTYQGTRDEDGVAVGVIAIEVEIAGGADLTDLISEVMEAAMDEAGDETGEEMPDVDIGSADLTLDFEGEGILLWDLAAGRIYSFDISGGGSVALDASVSGDMGGGPMDADLAVEFSWTLSETVTTE